MNSEEVFLSSSERAILFTEEATHLIEQKERVEKAFNQNDPALTLDAAKSFLECIFKTIINDQNHNADDSKDLSPLYKDVRDTLVLNRDEVANKLISTLTNTIVHHIGELRNKFGAASHGKDGYFENPVGISEAEMIIYFTDGLAGFLLRKNKERNDPGSAARIYYNDYPDFNDFLDTQWEGYKLQLGGNELDIPTSQLIFNFDPNLYREMLLQHNNSKEEDD